MKRKEYKEYDEDMPIGKLTQVKNFLPPPEELVMPEETVRVTIFLKKSSVEFFRRAAKKHHSKYQKMIRAVLDRYVARYR